MRSNVSASVLSIASKLRLGVAFTLFSFVCITAIFIGCGGGGGSLVTQKTTPVITWPAPAAITYGTALSSTQLDATASVAGTFAYTPAVGKVLTAGTQTLSVIFTPTDTTDYNGATASVSLTVKQAVPVVTWPTPAAITDSTALSTTQLDATAAFNGATIPGSFAYTPAAGATLTAGTQTLSVIFTPTDTTDYTTVNASVNITVNPSVPTITGLTPRYAVCDSFGCDVPSVLTCAGCDQGDILHDMTGIFPDLTLSSAESSLDYSSVWQEGNFEPTFDTVEIQQEPGGKYGNQWSAAFLGTGSQSTLAISKTTGTVFQQQETSGKVYTLSSTGISGVLFSASKTLNTPSSVYVDDVTGDLVQAYASSPAGFGVYDQAGSNLCYVNFTKITYLSSVAAKGGYVIFTAPNENLVGFASLAGCTGNVAIGYKTVSVAGQPWAVAMTNGTELDAYVVSRDTFQNGLSGLTKIGIPSGTVEGTVSLTGITPVSTVRAKNPQEGLYQVQAFEENSAAGTVAVLSTSDGLVLLINTDTSNGKAMQIAHAVAVPEIPFGIAAQETSTGSLLWVAYILADGGEAVTHLGTIDPITGDYTPNVGSCQSGLLGNIAGNANGMYCGGDTFQSGTETDVIQSLPKLLP